ncbi:MAG: hypothetical protein KAS12_01235 [Candidatus Aenigmarchaeota archaeon]|nr:hypothetical protein [Candidatus Aenigmarchaeota archaeon]
MDIKNFLLSIDGQIEIAKQNISTENRSPGCINIDEFAKRDKILETLKEKIEALKGIRSIEIKENNTRTSEVEERLRFEIAEQKATLEHTLNIIDKKINQIGEVYNTINTIHENEKVILKSLQNINTPHEAPIKNKPKLWADAIQNNKSWIEDGKTPDDMFKETASKTFSKNDNRIYVDDHLYLEAKTVKTINDVASNGALHFVDENKIFAIYIAKKLFYGSIGTIYQPSIERPIKVITCRHSRTGCGRGSSCHFFHDQKLFPKSTDVRNFTNQNLQFNPQTNNELFCRYGSINTLTADWRRLTTEEKGRYDSLTMHHILCSLLIRE